MSIADLLNLDGVLANVETEGVSDDGVAGAATSDVDVKCWIEQVQASENTAIGDQQTETWRIYLPAGTSCDGSSRLAVNDMVLEFDGPPWPAVNPRTTVESHVEATARRVR